MADDADAAGLKRNGSGYRRVVTIAVLLTLAVAVNQNLPTAQADNRRLNDSVAHTTMGVWSERLLDRTVVVAVNGQPSS